eukprot:327119-Pyramimonas_sp.AAC.1
MQALRRGEMHRQRLVPLARVPGLGQSQPPPQRRLRPYELPNKTQGANEKNKGGKREERDTWRPRAAIGLQLA